MLLLRSSGVFVTPSACRHLPDQGLVQRTITDCFHHGEMFKVVVCLEQCIACEELNQDASYTPDVTREAPSKVEDDFWGSVMSGANNRRVVLLIEGCRAKINEPDFGV